MTWRWAPLWTPTEQQEADTFDKTMDAVVKLQNTGAIPDRAFAEGVQNLMEEREYIPGLGAALAKLPESERFGLSGGDDDGTDPSELTQSGNGEEGGDPRLEGGAGGVGSTPARRAANDKAGEK
ncbi:hypothetical protein FHT02_000535 [Sphingomonas xinjiangensis]|uniref:Uncharacterized protein n=1 Tax=Sphingomonas xinjiangensis TaxID=643568 RepID=A0A840YBB9_9SPHN|nr:hypothetical protein [Sphingomonas xinjiangensis]